MVVNLGRIVIASDKSAPAGVHRIGVSVRALAVLAGNEPLLQKSDIDVAVDVPLGTAEAVKIDGRLSSLALVVGTRTYGVVLGLLEGNAAEQPRIAGVQPSTAATDTAAAGAPVIVELDTSALPVQPLAVAAHVPGGGAAATLAPTASPVLALSAPVEPLEAISLRFELTQFSVLAIGTDGKDLARLNLERVEMTFAQHDMERDLKLSLHALVVQDLRQSAGAMFGKLITSQTGAAAATDDLLSVRFTESLVPARRSIDCKLQALEISIVQETVSALLDLLYVGFISQVPSNPSAVFSLTSPLPQYPLRPHPQRPIAIPPALAVLAANRCAPGCVCLLVPSP